MQPQIHHLQKAIASSHALLAALKLCCRAQVGKSGFQAEQGNQRFFYVSKLSLDIKFLKKI